MSTSGTRMDTGGGYRRILHENQKDPSHGEIATEANARLLAAAPELLDIAWQAVAAFDFLARKAASAEDRREFQRRATAAGAIIAKTEGGP